MAAILTTARLAGRLNDPDLVLLDLRPMAAYNGWRLQGEARGGHIPGAVACPAAWLDRFDQEEAARLLHSKGVTQDKTVVVYGYAQETSAAVAARLERLGYPQVFLYPDGLAAWAAHPELPLHHLPHYQRLVHPAWVQALIRGESPETYPGKGFRVFHVNFGWPEEYAAGHLPGAVHLDTNALESPDTWNRRSPSELEAALRAFGITHDLTLVLYGRDTPPSPGEVQPGRKAGQIAAMRAAAILMYAGAQDVRLLDGGYDAWRAAGYPVETTIIEPVPVNAFGATIPARPQYFIDLPEAQALLEDPGGRLVSIRTWQEYTGETSGYDYIVPRGRIPGSVWGNCGSDAYHMQHYRNQDNTMRAYPEIEANWRQAGITADHRVAFYCGTGWRASEAFFYASLLGWEQISVYDGGWLEWSRDPANPVATGDP